MSTMRTFAGMLNQALPNKQVLKEAPKSKAENLWAKMFTTKVKEPK